MAEAAEHRVAGIRWRFSVRLLSLEKMKLTLILAFLVVAVVALGAPPAEVAGMKFRQTVPHQSAFDATGTELLLNRNGSYAGLRSLEWREGTSGVGAGGTTLISVLTDISIPRNGTWTYRVVDPATAEIVLDGRALRLRFDAGTATTGYVDEPFVGFQLVTRFWFEAYDATTRLANCSTRSYVAPGRSVSFGFVVSDGEQRVLVRAVGAGLRSFGITQPLENLKLRIYEAGSSLPVDAGLPPSTRATLDIAAQRAGAFPLPSVNDIGKYLILQKGAYIAEVAALDGVAAGEVLIEVYQLP
jgi:hypothetical protein